MSGKRPVTSRLLRALTVVLGSVVILYLAGAAFLSTSWFHGYLLRRVTANLEALTGARVEIKRLDIRPLIFQAALSGLVLHGKEPPAEPPLFSAASVVLGLDPVSLLRRKLLLRRLDLDSAQASIHTYSDGSTNIPGPERSFVDALLDMSIGTLIVTRTNFSWDDQRVPVELSARNVAVSLSYSLDSYSGSFAASALELKSGSWPLPPLTVSTRLKFSRHSFEASEVAWRLAESRGAGLSGHGSLKLTGLPKPDAEFSLQASGDLAQAAQILRIRELKRGSFALQGQGTYRNGELAGGGRVQAREVVVHSAVFEADHIGFTTDYTLEGRHVALNKVSVSLLGGTVQGRVNVALEGSTPKFSARVELRGLDLESSLRAASEGQALLAPIPLAGSVGGAVDASWRGNFRGFESRFDLTLDPVEAPTGTQPVKGFAKGTVKTAPEVSIDLEEADFHTPHSSLNVKGSVGTQQSKLAVQLETSDFEEWKPLAESLLGRSDDLVLQSTAVFAGAVSGPIRQPDVQGRLKVDSFQYRGWSWAGLEGTVDAAPGRLQITDGKLLGPAGILAFDVSVGLEQWRFTPQSPLRVEARTERTSIEGLRATFNVHAPVTGLASGLLNLEGTTSKLTGSGTLRVDGGGIDGEPFDRLTAAVRVAQTLWTFDGVELRKGSGRMTGQASVDFSTGGLALDFHGSDFKLAEFKLLDRLPRPSGQPGLVSGQLGFDVRAQGNRENPQLASTFVVHSLDVNGTALGDLKGQCDWRDKQLDLQVGVAGPGGSLRATGLVKTQGNWPVELDADYTGFHADPWIRLLSRQAVAAAVVTSGHVKLTGPLKAPAQLEVHGRAEKLEVSFPDLKWTNDQPVELSYVNRVLKASRFRLRGPSTDLEVEGSVEMAEPMRLSASVQGHGDAQLLKLFAPQLQSTGSFDLNLQASGTTAEPALNGTLTIKGLSLAYGEVPFRLAGLSGDIQLQGNRFTLRSMRGAGSGGSIEINGNGTIYGNPRCDLRASLTQARIEFPPEITSSLSGTIHFVGTPEGGQIDGELSIQHSFVNEGFNLLAWIGQIGGQPLASSPGLASPWASKVTLNVGVSSSPDVHLESHDLTAVATIDMNVRGTLARPVGFGEVHVESGEAVIRGDRYKLTRGDITLSNPFRTQAVVDLEAQTRVQRYDLTLQVTGPAERLKVSYRSDPPLPTSDILALLALGYSSQQQGLTATGSSQAFNTLGASTLLSQALSTQMSGRLQRLFGVSRIKIDPNVYGPGAGYGPRVTIEEQVTRDFSLTYSTNTAGAQQELIQLEYALSDRVSLIGERDENGVFGVEVRFRHRFR